MGCDTQFTDPAEIRAWKEADKQSHFPIMVEVNEEFGGDKLSEEIAKAIEDARAKTKHNVGDNTKAHAEDVEKKENALEEANRLIHGNRNDDYGHPYHDFSRSAKMWSAILGVEVQPWQIPLCMIAVKISREINRAKHDNIVDIAGYAGTLEMVREYEEANDL